MPSVTYEFVPGQMVYVIDDGTVKSGTVTLVEITVDSSGTEITYWIQVNGDSSSTAFDEEDVFATCRSASGYQDAVYLTDLTGSPSDVAIDGSPLPINLGSPVGSPIGSPALVLQADVLIDGTTTVTLSHVVVGGETYAELVSEMNTQLGALATASLYQNNIRITSATKGSSSSIKIGTGSPAEENYFRFLNDFTGLAAPVDGLDEGAIEELGDRTCTR